MTRATARKPPTSPVESALDRARHGGRVIVRRGKKPVAAVVSIADLKLLEELEDRYDVSASISRLANPKEKRIFYPTARLTCLENCIKTYAKAKIQCTIDNRCA